MINWCNTVGVGEWYDFGVEEDRAVHAISVSVTAPQEEPGNQAKDHQNSNYWTGDDADF